MGKEKSPTCMEDSRSGRGCFIKILSSTFGERGYCPYSTGKEIESHIYMVLTSLHGRERLAGTLGSKVSALLAHSYAVSKDG